MAVENHLMEEDHNRVGMAIQLLLVKLRDLPLQAGQLSSEHWWTCLLNYCIWRPMSCIGLARFPNDDEGRGQIVDNDGRERCLERHAGASGVYCYMR